MKRSFLFLATNLAVMLVLSVTVRLLNTLVVFFARIAALRHSQPAAAGTSR
jgi:hypothetical protein